MMCMFGGSRVARVHQHGTVSVGHQVDSAGSPLPWLIAEPITLSNSKTDDIRSGAGLHRMGMVLCVCFA